MEDLASFLTRYAYLALFVGIVGENLGLPLPGEILVLLAAAVAAQAGLTLSGIILVAALGAMLGDHGSYVIGRKSGGRLLNAYCHATLCPRNCGLKAEGFFNRFGIWTVTLGRFLPGLRTFAAPFAGVSRMPYGKFLAADLLGAAVWAATFTILGVRFGPPLAAILGRVIRFGGIVFAILVASLALTLGMRVRKARRQGILTVSDGVAR